MISAAAAGTDNWDTGPVELAAGTDTSLPPAAAGIPVPTCLQAQEHTHSRFTAEQMEETYRPPLEMHKDCSLAAEVEAGSNRQRTDCHKVQAAREPQLEPWWPACDRQVRAEEPGLRPTR